MANSTKMFTVDKFLGLNESADSTTELKMGEAAKAENFYITDGYNIQRRPGIRRWRPQPDESNYWVGSNNERMWSGYIEGREYLLFYVGNLLRGYCFTTQKYEQQTIPIGNILSIVQSGDEVFLILENPDTGEVYTPKLYVNYSVVEHGILDIALRVGGMYSYTPYIPLVLSGCSPTGGGTEREPLNILINRFRVQFTTDAENLDYVLPAMTSEVVGVHIGGQEYLPSQVGTYNTQTHTFTLNGCNSGMELIFVCATDDADLASAKARFLKMQHYEHFNGATDTRIFFYGDGSNVCYYTGVPSFGYNYGYGDRADYNTSSTRDGTHTKPALYVPAGNELTVDFSDSPITAMVRHYSRLLVFKPDGTEAISYEPVTLADGKVIAGFYLRPVSREIGNDAMGQVELVNNYARSFSKGSIYEWRISSYSYRDERYAKCISQKAVKTIAAADPSKIVACDDGVNKTYYVFLNDDAGTVLVNRYDLDAWSIYRSQLTTNVSQCVTAGGKMVFLCNGKLYCFDEEANYDASATEDGEDTAIEAVWESGFMAFGADYLKKYASRIWLSLFPENNAELEVTVRTDKRDDYITKTVGYSFLDFSNMDFTRFSFVTRKVPLVKRIQIKVKKFVYYKLIFRVCSPGCRATVLGYDQQIRYSSPVK